MTLSEAGEVVAEGELLGYDGRFYRLLGPYGEVALDGRSLTCEGAACPGPDWVERLRISGEPAILEGVLLPLLDAFAARRDLALDHSANGDGWTYAFLREGRPAGRIVLYATSSAESLADIVADAADLAVTRRPPSPLEADLAEEAGRGDLTAPGRSAILALDAFVPVVAVSNPVTSIEAATLGAILSGEIRDWSALGAPPGPIRLHLPAPRSGLGEAVASRLPVAGTLAVLHDDPGALAAAVADDPAALGIALLSAVGDVQALRLSGPCGAVATATPLSVKTGDYPLSLPVFLYAPARRLGAFARDVVDYLTSPIAQPLIARSGLIDQFPEAIAFAAQGDRLARGILAADGPLDVATLKRLVGEMQGAARLSISFRFEPRIDRARRAIGRQRRAPGRGDRAGRLRRAGTGLRRLLRRAWPGRDQRHALAPSRARRARGGGRPHRRCRRDALYRRLRGGAADGLRRDAERTAREPPGRGLAQIMAPRSGRGAGPHTSGVRH